VKFLGLMAATMVALTACGLPTARDLYGSGPIPNRAYIERGFLEYAKTMTPGYFFVSESGTYGYSYCQASACSGLEMRVAQDACLRSSNGSKCWIYARGSFVVWDEAGPAANAFPAMISSPSAKTEPTKAEKNRFFPINVRWDGYAKPVIGIIEIHSGVSATLTMELPDSGGTCRGGYFGKPNGRWSVVCQDSQYGSGTVAIVQSGRGTSGVGKDSLGRNIEFSVANNN